MSDHIVKNRIVIPQIKSYGDLVIACYSLAKYGNGQEIILCGRHLLNLVQAIGFENYEILECAEVPAFFDLKKRGIVAGVSSFATLRGALKEKLRPTDSVIIDKLGLKERLLYRGLHAFPIGPTYNIYRDYKLFFGASDVESSNCESFHPGDIVGVFPDSRVARKIIPDNLCVSLLEKLNALGYRCKLVKVGFGEDTEVIKYVNGFESLIDSIRGFDSIISSDSLPAHLAQMYEIPVFVMSPVDNSYWLPEYSLERKASCLFGNWNVAVDEFYGKSQTDF